MIIISHRGNLNGPSKYENTICRIELCLSKGLYVEVDVWKLPDEKSFRLGHNSPILHESIPLYFLENDKILCHCKNQEAYDYLKNNDKVLAFQHKDEKQVILKNKMIWKHSNNFNPSGKKDDIYVYLGKNKDGKLLEFGGICTDYPELLQDYLKENR